MILQVSIILIRIVHYHTRYYTTVVCAVLYWRSHRFFNTRHANSSQQSTCTVSSILAAVTVQQCDVQQIESLSRWSSINRVISIAPWLGSFCFYSVEIIFKRKERRLYIASNASRTSCSAWSEATFPFDSSLERHVSRDRLCCIHDGTRWLWSSAAFRTRIYASR